MVIKEEKISMIHISEISTVMFETPAVSITGVLLSELAKNKVCVIFCDEKHLPQGQYVPFSANYMTASHTQEQSDWDCNLKDIVWGEIVEQKIKRQGDLLSFKGKTEEYKMLMSYSKEILPGDSTNREGFAAKVYFNALFEQGFSRRDDSIDYNACLNYGYAILLAMVSREIVKCGYSMALGLHHRGVFNSTNLSCDIMEPFRVIVDYIVISNYKGSLDLKMKRILWNLGNTEVFINGKKAYLYNRIFPISWSIPNRYSTCS